MEGLYGPKFEVLHTFKAANGADCRIVTEDRAVKGMMRGESWNKREQKWQQWLQSGEASEILERVGEAKSAVEARDSILIERDSIRAERDALRTERDQLKAERDALKEAAREA